MIRRLLREPLVHFLLLGALLFLAYGWLDRDDSRASGEIVLTRSQADTLVAQFEQVWQRAPTAAERQALIEGWVRDEIFYREAVAMGLDRDDPVVRRRMGQKVQFILDSGTQAAPTDAELKLWLDVHAGEYRVEPVYTLRQVYFDPSRYGASAAQTITAARAALETGGVPRGDPTMLPAALEGSASEIRRHFGDEFEEALRTLPLSRWAGPVRSAQGFHLVRLDGRMEDRPARLEEVRSTVERDFAHARAQTANAAYYQQLRSKYVVRIEAGDGASG